MLYIHVYTHTHTYMLMYILYISEEMSAALFKNDSAGLKKYRYINS